ncbi:MAG TPA: molecular chaperone DnaK, partial [Synergistaceae bacterium]|nr:molecular chaperone DnaK [Synergistaceae bacterium]
NQTQVEISVLQGERAMAADNVGLGKFILDGIPSAPRGIPQIEVTFNMDVNGILNVSAKDKGTGKAQNISIHSSNLSKEQIERMKTDAESFEEEDKRKREAAETKNEADSAAFAAERLLSENGDKMTADEKADITGKMEEVRRLMGGDDLEALKSAKSALERAIQDFSTRLYSQQGQQGGASSGGPSSGADAGETVDAEFTEPDQK